MLPYESHIGDARMSPGEWEPKVSAQSGDERRARAAHSKVQGSYERAEGGRV